ncbi:conserved membrane hypothetical protein [Paraburkholderia tropica]|uniref:hypothetical protein n=1 Tax=Paraburkholderia tropica TaxID=92647 RepID=UPI001CAB8598|nr:hypothetical protein [Paraburkholderia tropica]CAG9235915.1 conserved membrane hypothetical protein [Paraburkholderia tropica]
MLSTTNVLGEEAVERAEQQLSGAARAFPLLLAVLATGTSIWVSAIAGYERGADEAERIAWIALGLVMLLAAHLIPALYRRMGHFMRIPAIGVWVISLAATSYGHATFFVNAQQDAGAARAASMATPVEVAMPSAGRGLTDIARDQAATERQLARAYARVCERQCASLIATRKGLEAKRKALGVEFSEATKRESQADAAEARKAKLEARADALRSDPVTLRLSQMTGIASSTIDLTVALGLGLLVECVACLMWTIVLGNPHRATTARTLVMQPASPAADDRDASLAVAVAPPAATSEDPPKFTLIQGGAGDEVTGEMLDAVERVEAAVAVGAIRPTVKEIREFLACGQSWASAVRKAGLARWRLDDVDLPRHRSVAASR